MNEMDWSDVRPRLAALAASAGVAEVVGAPSHGWELEAPLTEGELAELESQLGLVLPAEYRSFLIEAGRGGAGCALREALVVSGPSRGQMWSDDTADEGGFHPLHNADGSRMTFTDWYRTWLSGVEHEVATHENA